MWKRTEPGLHAKSETDEGTDCSVVHESRQTSGFLRIGDTKRNSLQLLERMFDEYKINRKEEIHITTRKWTASNHNQTSHPKF